MALKIKGGFKNFKKTNHWTLQKIDSQTLEKFLVCYFIAIKVQKWFIKFQVTLL